MANGEECTHCGYQETDHDLKRAVKENGTLCHNFVSTFKHKRGCPVIGCEGNCDQMIAESKRAKAEEANWQSEFSWPRRLR